MKTSMNLLLWTTHVTEEHFPLLGKLKAAGFDGVEIPLFGGDASHYKKVRQELDRQGLGCTAVTICTPENRLISGISFLSAHRTFFEGNPGLAIGCLP